jgi:hypothetical protein
LLISKFLGFSLNPSVTYTPSISGSATEVGCSIFGHNNFTIGIYDDIPSNFRTANPLFKITSGSLVKQISCQWNHTGKSIACPCVAVYDGNLNLPQLFSYSLSFDQQLFFEPPSTKITYFKLENFLFSSVGKIDTNMIDYPIYISNFKNRFDSTFNYTWYLKNVDNNEKVKINCDLISEDRFKCSNLSVLSTNWSPNNGTNNTDLIRLCGTKLASNVPCALYFDVEIVGSLNPNSPLEQLSGTPYYVYRLTYLLLNFQSNCFIDHL